MYKHLVVYFAYTQFSFLFPHSQPRGLSTYAPWHTALYGTAFVWHVREYIQCVVQNKRKTVCVWEMETAPCQ